MRNVEVGFGRNRLYLPTKLHREWEKSEILLNSSMRVDHKSGIEQVKLHVLPSILNGLDRIRLKF